MNESTPTEEVDLTGTGADVLGGMAIDPSSGLALTEDDLATSQDTALPEDQTTESAEDSEDETSTELVESDSDVEEDENLAWAKKIGVDPTDPDALAKLAKIARDNQRTTRQEQQSVSELDRAMDSLSAQVTPQYPYGYPPQYQQQPQYPQYDPNAEYSDPYQPPVVPQGPTQEQIREAKSNIAFLKVDKAIAKGSEIDQELGKIIAEDPLMWAGSEVRLERAYQLAKATVDSHNTEARIEAARLEERQLLAKKSAATSPQAQAHSAKAANDFSTLTAKNFDAYMAQVSPEEYKKRLPEINAVVAKLR